MIGFYRAYDLYGEFSNWYMHDMIINGRQYCSAEQYLMWCKATLFEDRVVADEILRSRNNYDIKRLGRKVQGFSNYIWLENREDIMCTALRAKFGKGSTLHSILMNTGDELLVECSPSDTIWGIGLSTTDPRRLDKTNWRGTNLLGECLMRVREELRSE